MDDTGSVFNTYRLLAGVAFIRAAVGYFQLCLFFRKGGRPIPVTSDKVVHAPLADNQHSTFKRDYKFLGDEYFKVVF
jgi:hypothetical protein